LSLLALVVLAGVLAATFSGLRRGAPPGSQAFQSLIETPTHPSKPTLMTPSPTILPEPSPPLVTVTLPPYPPPQTPTPLGTLTVVPTPRVTAAPPAPGTPTAVPTPSGPLPPGLKVVYGETDGLSGKTTIWLASAANPTLRRVLATFDHKVGYGVQGAVSPDGNKIVCLVIPSDAGERAARTTAGELWVVDLDDASLHRLANQAGYLAMWTPDSRALVFGRLVALENPKNPQAPFRTELYLVTADGAEQRLLLVDETAYGLQPLGWSVDGQQFYYAIVTLQGQWELWTVDRTGGLTQFQASFPSQYLIQSASLSPDGTKVLLKVLDRGQYALIVLRVDGLEQKTIVSGATGDQPINQYAAIWSPDDQSIFAHIPPQPGQPAHLERIDLRTGQRRVIPTEPIGRDEFVIPQAWSPDGKWLVVLKYPRLQSLAYLMQATGGPMAQIPLTQSSNWVNLFGWTDRR
jgi:Tol biopolymer transport system component